MGVSLKLVGGAEIEWQQSNEKWVTKQYFDSYQ